MDFRHEVANRDRAAELMKHRDNVKFPAVHHVTRRTMVMEFMEGVRVTDVAAQVRQGLAPADVARLLMEVFSEQMFVHGFIHCDPHPGMLTFWLFLMLSPSPSPPFPSLSLSISLSFGVLLLLLDG